MNLYSPVIRSISILLKFKIVKYLDMKYKIVVSIFLILLSLKCFSQHNTRSPYSMFGIGEMENRAYGMNSGMGGTEIGTRVPNYLNTLNPAGVYLDSLSVVFDVSAAMKNSWFSNGDLKARITSVNLKKLAMGFRVARPWIVNIGIMPFSNMEYEILTYQPVEGSTSTLPATFSGTGGLSRLYWSNAFYLNREFSLGVKASYLFGNFSKTETMGSQAAVETSSANKVFLEFGAQYNKEINEDLSYTFGATYGYKRRIKLINERVISINNTFEKFPSTITHVPQYFGFGGSFLQYSGHRRLFYALDYTFENWASIKSDVPRVYYENSHKINFGMQYTPNYRTPRNYIQRMEYQIGGYYNRTHLRIGSSNLHEAGMTMGVKLPLRNRSRILLAADAGWRGGNGLINEKYLTFTLAVSMAETWFVKWVYN